MVFAVEKDGMMLVVRKLKLLVDTIVVLLKILLIHFFVKEIITRRIIKLKGILSIEKCDGQIYIIIAIRV